MAHTIRAAFLAIVAASGCVGEADELGERPELEPLPTAELSGRTLDYFSGDPIAQVPLETMGLAPEASSTSNGAAAFAFPEVPEESWFFVRTGSTVTHHSTISELSVSAASITRDVYVVATGYLQRQYATQGSAMEPGVTTVFVEVVDSVGAPVSGLSRADLAIIDEGGNVVATEPLVFGALGDVDPGLDTGVVHNGTARFAFLNVPPGFHTLALTCSNCVDAFESSQPIVAASGVTLARVVAGSTPPVSQSSFAAIHGLLASGSQGGLGCANCHTEGGAAPIAFDAPQADVHQALLDRGLIDTENPAASLLLTKPLYETPANHPNATFLSPDDPKYQQLLTWIQSGAPLD